MPIEPNFPQAGSTPRTGNAEAPSARDNYRAATADAASGQDGVRRLLDIAVGEVQRFDGQARQKSTRDPGYKVIRFPKPEDFDLMRQLLSSRTPVRRGTFLNIIV